MTANQISLKGIATSSGIAIGPVYILKELYVDISLQQIIESEVPQEIQKFDSCIIYVKNQINKAYEKTSREYGESYAEVFKGQIALMEDEYFLQEVKDEIKNSHLSAEAATFKIFSQKKEYFLKLDDEYFKDRAFDIQDLKRQIIFALRGESRDYKLDHPSIIVASDISPSDTIHFQRENILAIVTEFGGVTSHASILARSLGIPSITGLKNIVSLVEQDKTIVIDGIHGDVFINPTEEIQAKYYVDRIVYDKYNRKLKDYLDLPLQLADGEDIEIMGNVEFIEELEKMKSYNINSIGLYRTEGFFLQNNFIPDEETQYQEFLKLKAAMAGNKVIIRTLDIGGDKIHKKYEKFHEENPFLGWRAIRLSLDEIGMFQSQLRAIMRSSKGANFRIMFPMITDFTELTEAKSILNEVINQLKMKGVKIDEKIPVGMMIETPATAFMIEDFIHEVDFISIGTNDLVQYTLAVDRGNEKVSYLYQSHHPSVLKLIKHIIDVAILNDTEVSMCGEMASDELSFPLLIGMGLRSFSMTASKSLKLRRMMNDLTMKECMDLYRNVSEFNSYIEVNHYLETWFNKKFPDLII